jgi:hypothetical protein
LNSIPSTDKNKKIKNEKIKKDKRKKGVTFSTRSQEYYKPHKGFNTDWKNSIIT